MDVPKQTKKFLSTFLALIKKITFYLFKFHDYFDGLIGSESLAKLEALLDIANSKLSLPEKTFMLEFKQLGPPEEEINSKCVKFIKIPVTKKTGDVLLPKNIKINEIIIPCGIYKASNGYIDVMATNFGDTTTFRWTKPNKTIPLKKFNEINQIDTIKEFKQSITINDLNHLIRTEHLCNYEKDELFKILLKHPKIIQQEGEKLSFTNMIQHKIHTKDEIPVHTKSYRYPNIHKLEIEKQIDEMLQDGIIQNSISPWTSPIWIVPKKIDSSGKPKWRLVIDYRKLNEKTVDDKFPMPNIEEILDKLGRSVYFTTIDLKSGFHQIKVDKKDRPKTAFSTDKGHFEFIRMPFGLKNAPATFQRAMNILLSNLIGKCCLVYMDDIIVFGASLQQHLDNLNKVLSKLEEANFKIQLDKCEFLKKECEFLGHIVTEEGIKPNPNKIEKVLNWPLPKTQKEIKGFLGLVGYYRRFIKDFAQLTKPMTKCLKKGAIIIQDEKFKQCFKDCQTILTTDPILRYPDFNKQFILETDASDYALGAVLSQKFEDNKEHPIAYASRTLNDTEVNWSATEKELAAIVWAVKHFRPYIYGTRPILRTDHKALLWLRQKKDLNKKLLNMKLALEEYEFGALEYKKGKLNQNADALSRLKQETEINTSSVESTQHSADTDDNDFIYSTERPLNEFRNQIILEKSNEDKTECKMLFRTFTRITIKKTLFSPAVLINILKTYLSPTCVNGLYCDTSILGNLQIIYKNYFARAKSLKIVWTETFLEDIEDEEEQDQIIQIRHEYNHRGIVETCKHIKRTFFFPKMKSKVAKYINLCKLCQRSKYERHPYKLKFKLTETPEKPLQIVHMDIFIIKQKNYLTFCDRFSKLAAAIPIKTRNAVDVLRALSTFFASAGKPKLIVMDQEGAFTSITIRTFLEENEIQYHYTSTGQSSSNGTVEIVHRTLRELHNILSNKESTKDLAETTKISLATAIYNDSIHSQTNLTPRELFHGYRNETPIPEDLDERIRQKEKMYHEIQIKSHMKKQKELEKINQTREFCDHFSDNQTVYERKRNNLKHQERYRDTTVKQNRDVNIIDKDDRKIHKAKLKRQRKLNY